MTQQIPTFLHYLPTEAPSLIEENSFYPTEDHDSSTRGGDYVDQVEIQKPTPIIETQQLDEIGDELKATGEIGGVPTIKTNDENVEEIKDTRVK